MRDPRVFGPSEEFSLVNSEEDEHVPDPEPFAEEDEIVPYGSALREIQRSDLRKCLFQRVHSQGHFSPSMPLRRLSLELKHFLKDHPSYISLAPIGDNLCSLLASIEGPPGTPYEKGIFYIRIDCPDNYPVRPPVCNFITKIYHPNISQGRICVNILEEAWSPTLTMESILLSICSMLPDPFFNDPLDKEIAEQYKRDKTVYESNARLWTQKYATGQRPTDEELDFAREWNERLALTLEKNRDARLRWDEDVRFRKAREDGLW